MNTSNNPTRASGLHHVGIFSRNMDATLRFYVDGLGFTRRYGWNGALGEQGDTRFDFDLAGVMLDAGDGNYFEIFPRDPTSSESEPSFPLNHIALRTADIETAYQHALEHGGKPHAFNFPDKAWNGAPLVVTMHGEPKRVARIAFVRGPDGELIEFFQNDSL